MWGLANLANLSRINVPLESSSFLPATYPLRVDLWDLTFFLVLAFFSQRKTVSDYPVLVELLANGKLQVNNDSYWLLISIVPPYYIAFYFSILSVFR